MGSKNLVKPAQENKETPAVLRIGRSQVDRDPLEVKFVARGPVILAIPLRTSHLH
jgi:hypothetical protein